MPTQNLPLQELNIPNGELLGTWKGRGCDATPHDRWGSAGAPPTWPGANSAAAAAKPWGCTLEGRHHEATETGSIGRRGTLWAFEDPALDPWFLEPLQPYNPSNLEATCPYTQKLQVVHTFAT